MRKFVLKNLAIAAWRVMLHCSLRLATWSCFSLLVCCALLLAALPAAAQVTVSVDATLNQRPINPLIYGVAFGSTTQLNDLNAPANRWGGNSTTPYNWQTNSHNTPQHYYYETIATSPPRLH